MAPQHLPRTAAQSRFRPQLVQAPDAHNAVLPSAKHQLLARGQFRIYDESLALTEQMLGYESDAILVDGNGVLHPNGFGLACHLGVLCGIPTVGIGKTLHHVDGLSKRGDWTKVNPWRVG